MDNQTIIDEISRLLSLRTREESLLAFFNAKTVAEMSEAKNKLTPQDLGDSVVRYLFENGQFPKDDDAIKILLHLNYNNFLNNKWNLFKYLINSFDIDRLKRMLEDRTIILGHSDIKLQRCLYLNIMRMKPNKSDRQELLLKHIEDRDFMMILMLYDLPMSNHIKFLMDRGYKLNIPDKMVLYLILKCDRIKIKELKDRGYDFNKEIFEGKSAIFLGIVPHPGAPNFERERLLDIMLGDEKLSTPISFTINIMQKLHDLVEKINSINEVLHENEFYHDLFFPITPSNM